MTQEYSRLKRLVGQDTKGRFALINEEIEKMGLAAKVYEIDSPRGKDKHLVVHFDYGAEKELWLTANYDTFETLPSANNNGSGVTTLLGVAEHLRVAELPVNVRIIYFDAGLDTDLIERRRSADFVPGSELFLQHVVDNEIEAIEKYAGSVVVQAVGKGGLCLFEKTGKKIGNSEWLNRKLVAYGKSSGTNIEIKERSPPADNLSFLKKGLEATVLARYHEGSWHRMQTKQDDMTNVSVADIDGTILFLYDLLKSDISGDTT